MDSYKKLSLERAECLECGAELESTSRGNQKFCCDKCRYDYYNHRRARKKQVRIMVDAILLQNYNILDGCVESGKDSISLNEAVAMGFNPGYITSRIGLVSCNEYTCYDIAYRMSDAKIFNIHRMFVNLRNRKI